MKSPRQKKSSSISGFIIIAFSIWCLGVVYLMFPPSVTFGVNNVATLVNIDSNVEGVKEKMNCHSMNYWKPQNFDKTFTVPYTKYGRQTTKYVTFEPVF
jgi:hypothetical protein